MRWDNRLCYFSIEGLRILWDRTRRDGIQFLRQDHQAQVVFMWEVVDSHYCIERFQRAEDVEYFELGKEHQSVSKGALAAPGAAPFYGPIPPICKVGLVRGLLQQL